MDFKKFFGAEDAARYAASITDSWQNEEGEIWDAQTLIEAANYADGENPLDEDFTSEYYVVDENGALGYTGDDCNDIYWWVTPVNIVTEVQKSPETSFCPHCGARVEKGWIFCDKCGGKL